MRIDSVFVNNIVSYKKINNNTLMMFAQPFLKHEARLKIKMLRQTLVGENDKSVSSKDLKRMKKVLTKSLLEPGNVVITLR